MVHEQQKLESQIRQQLDGISPRRQAFDRWLLKMAALASIRRWPRCHPIGVLRDWLLTAKGAPPTVVAGPEFDPVTEAS